MHFIKHVAGEFDNDLKMQICTLCGEMLASYNGVNFVGVAPKGFQPGCDIFVLSEKGRQLTCVAISDQDTFDLCVRRR